MQKVFNAGEELFFDILVICLVSFIYFEFIPMTNTTILVGIVFSILYFGANIYVGYKYNLNLSDSLMVGVMGCGVGLFLSFFSIYAQIILNSPNMALWISKIYFIPTMSLIKLFLSNINLSYVFILMIINILLVVIGGIIKKLMNKLSHKN